MNINIQLPKELENKITDRANEKLAEVVDNILNNDAEVDELIRATIKGQVKSCALTILQGQDLRSKMAQKIYPIVYETLGLTSRKEEQNEGN